MHQTTMAFVFLVALLVGAQTATADCLVRARLDQMQQVQVRLVQNPNALFFRDDIRRLRTLSDGLGTPEVLRAVAGNHWVGHGPAFRRFLENTNRLLRRASLDDPQSVRPHFDARTQQNLREVAGYMGELRCTAAQISSARIAVSQPQDTTTQNAPVNIPTGLILAAAVLLGIAALRLSLQIPLLLQRGRAKRFKLNYATRFWWNNHMNTALLLDINHNGTRLRHRADKPLPPGAELDIAIDKDWTTGTIVWSDKSESGVHFMADLRHATMEKVCAVADNEKTNPTTPNGAPKDAV